MGMLLAPRFLRNMAAYTIKNAALFDGTTGYLSFTLTTSATHSGSVWVERVKLGSVQPILDGSVYFNASDQLVVNGLTSTALYRDPTAFLHIFWNASGAWVNGVAVTGTGTYSTASIVNPRFSFDGTHYAAGYRAEFAFFNGTSESLTGGKTDSATGTWISNGVAGTPHTYLKFENGAGLSDNSGSAGAWTQTGAVRQVISTPTDLFATLNPLDMHSVITLSNGNRTITNASGLSGGVAGTVSFDIAASKLEWQLSITSNPYFMPGILPVADTTNITTNNPSLQRMYYGNTGQTFIGVTNAVYGATFTTGDKIKIRINNGAVNFFKWITGAWVDQGVAWSGLTGNWRPWFNTAGVCSGDVAFGQAVFTPSPGFLTLTTSNLPARSPKTPTTPQTGSFTGNGVANGPFINLGMSIDKAGTSTINGNAITWGTHADATAVGVKIRTALATHNGAGVNAYSFAVKAYTGGANVVPATAQGNP